MTCWNVLGLAPDADSRAIKRQYAALLKKTRPDDDPEGFQRLREAYEAALAWSQSLQEVDEVIIDIRGDSLADHYQAAMAHGNALHFEIQLLLRDIEGHLNPEDTRWAFETFNWLTAWQRLELPGELIERL